MTVFPSFLCNQMWPRTPSPPAERGMGASWSSHVGGRLCFAFPSAAWDTTVLDAGLVLALGRDGDAIFEKEPGSLMTLQDSATTKPWGALLSL